jgi:hypothetical protein
VRGLLIDSLRQEIIAVDIEKVGDYFDVMLCREIEVIALPEGDLVIDVDEVKWRYGFAYDGLGIWGNAVMLGHNESECLLGDISVEWMRLGRKKL